MSLSESNPLLGMKNMESARFPVAGCLWNGKPNKKSTANTRLRFCWRLRRTMEQVVAACRNIHRYNVSNGWHHPTPPDPHITWWCGHKYRQSRGRPMMLSQVNQSIYPCSQKWRTKSDSLRSFWWVIGFCHVNWGFSPSMAIFSDERLPLPSPFHRQKSVCVRISQF